MSMIVCVKFVYNLYYTELICAVERGDLDIVRRLHQHNKVVVTAPDAIGDTPLMLAVKRDHLDIVRTLLEVPELQLHRCNSAGYTALHYACLFRRASIIKLICQDSRCSPSVVDKKKRSGRTALMLAAAVWWGDQDIVKELDRVGTELLTKDRYGRI